MGRKIRSYAKPEMRINDVKLLEFPTAPITCHHDHDHVSANDFERLLLEIIILTFNTNLSGNPIKHGPVGQPKCIYNDDS